MMIKGSCLCGAVRYEYAGEIAEISMCHCSQCRKAQGTAYIAVSPVESAKFRITAGAEVLKEYRSMPIKARVFCSNCGSPIYSARDDLPDIKRLRIGTIDTPFTCANQYHIFVGSKAPWHEITDDHPQHAEFKA